jgi:hypothetical protein
VQVEFQKLMDAGRIRTQDIGQDLLVMKNEVGSMCTLLGEQLQMEAQCLLQARYMKTLLVPDTIPLATTNFFMLIWKTEWIENVFYLYD